jgi:hypothetical protein
MSLPAAGGFRQPPLDPRDHRTGRGTRRSTPSRHRASPRDDRAEIVLPHSRHRVVVVYQQSGRVVVEVRDPHGLLIGVTSSSPLGGTHISYAARGDGWSLAYGQLAEWESGPTVWFGRRGPRGARARVSAIPLLLGRFWIAEVPRRATRVEISAAGSRVGRSRVSRSPH